MDGFFGVLLLALMPAAANFAGGMAAEFHDVTDRTVSVALHAAAGIVIAVVGLELMPQALTATRPWIPIVAFAVGGGFYLGAGQALRRIRARRGDRGASGPLLIWLGAAIDLFSDGVMIATGSVIDPQLGLLLALGQTPADVPEGFAAVASLRGANVPRGMRLGLAAGFVAVIMLGAALGFYVVRGRPDIVTVSLLAFTGGALTSVTIEEIVPQAHRTEDAWTATAALVGGFSLFALISAYFGQ